MATAPKTVTLTSPDGGKVRVSTPTDIVNLVYGSGYKLADGLSVDKAIASLATPNVEPASAEAPKAGDKKAS